MKKILIIATILTANIFAFDSVTYFGGVNAEGELTIKSPTSKDKQSQEYKLVAGMELNKELKAHKNIELGLGIRYEEDFEARSINYDDHFAATIPVYAMGKYKFNLDRNSNVYIKGTLGYNFVIEGDYIEDVKNAYPNAQGIKTEGGIYTGLGFGVEVNNFVGELNYNISRVGYTNQNNVKYDYENAKVSATIGYKLDM